MPELSLDELRSKANDIRKLIVRITTEAGSGHPSSSLSATEVVTALYFGGFLNYSPENPSDPDRDRFILSKGHACPVLYSAMAEAGYYTTDEIMTLRKLGSPWEGHPNMRRLEGIEASTGSLGQGLSLGVGHALGARMDGKSYHTYVMLGDGEMGEGQVWEAIASAEKYQLGNLTAIVDQNGYQQTGATKDVLDLTEFQPKLRSLRLACADDQRAMKWPSRCPEHWKRRETGSLTVRPRSSRKTQKGFGILPVLETTGDLNFHGKPLSARVWPSKALAHLGG